MKAQFCSKHCNEYDVTCNEVKVLKNGLNFTSLKVKVFPFLNTSLKVNVGLLKLLLKYSNALLLLRYCTTLGGIAIHRRLVAKSFRRTQGSFIHSLQTFI